MNALGQIFPSSTLSGTCGRAAGTVPVDDAQGMEVSEDREQRHSSLDADTELGPGLPLSQQQIQQVAADAMLHHNIYLATILEGAVEIGDPLDPAAHTQPFHQELSSYGMLSDRQCCCATLQKKSSKDYRDQVELRSFT